MSEKFILSENTSQFTAGMDARKNLSRLAGYPAACSGEGFIASKAGEYRSFRQQVGEYSYMDRRNIIISLLGGRSPLLPGLATDVSETLHLPILSNSNIGSGKALQARLEMAAPHGYVLEGLPNDQRSAAVVKEWAQTHGLVTQLFFIEGSLTEPETAVTKTATDGTLLHSLVGQNQDLVAQDFFKMISPVCFEDPQLAEKYYDFQKLCQRLNTPHILISGACSYIYWGRRPLKDLDILVPSRDSLVKIGQETKIEVEHLVSSYADTNYLNFSAGVEVVSNLTVLYQDDKGPHRIEFTFDEMMIDAQKVRFMGTNCTLMSPEMLLLFKFALGRFGMDQWQHHKDDYEDARGVIISQQVDLESLRKRAARIGALDRVRLGEEILDLDK